MSKTYYLAYGSNLNVRQMRYRCPNARKVGTMVLKDYQLEFKLYLTIDKKVGSEVPLGIWEVDELDEKRLDAYEGYPTFYRKEYIEIEVEGKKEKALIYIMNDVRNIEEPTKTYMNTCIEGYNDFGFSIKYLNEAFNRCIGK